MMDQNIIEVIEDLTVLGPMTIIWDDKWLVSWAYRRKLHTGKGKTLDDAIYNILRRVQPTL